MTQGPPTAGDTPAAAPERASGTITEWEVERAEFWRRKGSAVAFRNLLISIPCLLFAFAIWLYWSIIIVQMQNLNFPFSTAQLYTLPAIAGLAGATLRIPNSFMIAISGGRNVIAVTTALLMVPAVGVGIALQDMQTSYAAFAALAALSGIGGGAFASSMSNISFFFPKRMQGLSLGLNAERWCGSRTAGWYGCRRSWCSASLRSC
jgi:NNP family nitrate/nitrite transporter-like MFS transporter